MYKTIENYIQDCVENNPTIPLKVVEKHFLAIGLIQSVSSFQLEQEYSTTDEQTGYFVTFPKGSMFKEINVKHCSLEEVTKRLTSDYNWAVAFLKECSPIGTPFNVEWVTTRSVTPYEISMKAFLLRKQ